MPFRFNHKDLTILACQSSDNYAKEGLLWFKEKEGKLFNKSDIFTERLIRLRGNLLFYFKGKDKNSECSGVVVLERFNILSDSSFKKHGFIISFDASDEQKFEFGANNKTEYDDWTTLIQKASYEKMRMRLLELRDQITNITGQDPLPDYHPAIEDTDSKKKRVSLFSPTLLETSGKEEDVLMEMCVSCSNLLTDSDTCPSAMVKVFTVQPPETEWTKHSQTEVSEESREPSFLRTIVFSSSFKPLTRLKFVVYNVLNKSKSDTTTIGLSYCTLQEIQLAPNWQLTLSIMNMEMSVGNIVIQGWRRETRKSINGRSNSFALAEERKDGGLLEPPLTFVTNPIQRSFHFPTKDGSDLKFQTFLAESSLCFKIPKLLLSLFIAEEKEGVIELHNIGQLHPDWERIKQVVQNSHFDIVHQYSTNYADLCQFEEDNFKRSVDKAKKELEFIPTNLHLERLCVIEKNNYEHYYDFVTVGAPTAHSHKFKHGGLKRMIANNDENTRKILQGSSVYDEKRKSSSIKANHVKNELRNLKKDIAGIFVELRTVLESSDVELLNNATTYLSVKIGDLLGLQATSFVQDCETLLLKARTHGPELRIKSTIISSEIDIQGYRNLVWEWTGSEFKAVTSSNAEADCGVMDALANFTSKINSTLPVYDNVEELSQNVSHLETCITSLIRKINVTMRFILMQDVTDCPGLKDICYRKDVVFSQCLTSIVAGFSLMLSQRIHEKLFLDQLNQLGLLINFESLLTVYGDETGMVEDMYIGMNELNNVQFKIMKSDTDEAPTITGIRSNMIVTYSLKPKLFKLLPKRIQDGGLIKLNPVLFIMGINEQATLAEKFGDTSLQELINNENLSSLQTYLNDFIQLYPDHVGSRSSSATPLQVLMETLVTTVNTKKNKNYDILLQSEEICLRMNSLRLTSCKSGKDRSSMSVTLEIVRILEREHAMKEEVFQQVLNSLRSQGTRLINCYKNVGLAKYAFNKVQVKALPSPYRPPEGTIGKYVQT